MLYISSLIATYAVEDDENRETPTECKKRKRNERHKNNDMHNLSGK